ncbi:putative peptide ABC transporter substrate binding protein [Gordonia araii NBRC 100433]|uniref:Putative peptide ABC transporter substrate binding protein n=1 Tax=Gordonia araii NBRC 100433 TaxID=1073574 RepID=G7GYG6_9ACTN|nr:ABC transporter family substrate-binding protein [Gordonia araii]NNG97362.1 ABC transporter family substrate-binding protein [Gordonia araii NBRC 100433]GAB08641.1 putative peptide ABC transporter substrate binding protein [Gordonia araii NBRC 100433]
MRFARAVIAAIALSTAVAGCGVDLSTGSSFEPGQAQINEQPRENVREGGSLTTALTEVTPQWNSHQADGTAYTLALWRWYNPVLAYFSPDGEYSFNRDYLTDVKKAVVDGRTVVTYTIEPRATYNDGTPIDWRAFANTWRVNSGVDVRYTASSTDGYDQIESVTRGVDDKQAVVRFRGIWAWPDGLFNTLQHPKIVTPDDFNRSYVQNPRADLGAGPYTVESYDRNAGTVVFRRNPKWWGEPGKLDRRVFRQLEPQASINAFRNGELDATGVGSKDYRAQVVTMNGIDVRLSSSPANSLLVVNLATPALRDIRVREALLRGIDRETLARIRFTGLGYTEELPGSFLLFPFQPGYRDNVGSTITYDQERARRLLDDAGWVADGDGVRRQRDHPGQKLTLHLPILGDDAMGTNLARAMQAMLRQIGIDLAISVRPTSDFSKVVLGKEFDVFMMGFQSSDPFGTAYLCQIWCSNSQLNRSGAGSPELDAKIRRVQQIADPDEQIRAGNDVETDAFKQYSNLPLFNGPTMVAVKRGLANYGAGMFYVGPVEDIGWQK